MKTRSLVVCLLTILIANSRMIAQTHFEVESQNLISREKNGNFNISPAMDAYMTHAFNDSRWGTFAWFLVCKDWAEAYAGFTLAPTTWCQIGFGLGLEQVNNLWRVGGSTWLGYGRYSLLVLLEEGAGVFWHRAVINRKLNDVIGIGYMSEEFVGIGPRIEINIPKTPVKIWTSLLHKDRKNHCYLAFKFSF